MWLIFLLATLGFAIIALILVWIGNKVVNSIRRDNFKTENDMKKEEEENSKL